MLDAHQKHLLSVECCHQSSARCQEWIRRQLEKFPALTEERSAKIAAIVAGSRQHATGRMDQFDRSA